MTRRYRDRDWLEGRYHDDGLTQREIAELCSVSTATIRKQMKAFGIETREVAGEHHRMYGEERSDETKRKISEALRGREFSAETRRRFAERQLGRSVPEDIREKIADSLTGITRSEETRIRMSRSTAGANNPNWKGGGYSKAWYGARWTTVRDRVRERDRVCQECGRDGSVTGLDVHHIIPIRRFRETSGVSIDDANHESNLVLLCKSCHGKAEHGLIDIEPRDWESIPTAIRNSLDS